MKSLVTPLLAASACVVLSLPAAAQETINTGWWIVAGSLRYDADLGHGEMTSDKIWNSVRRCGVEGMTAPSSAFNTFQPGLTVVVVGPYPDPGIAARYLDQVRPCAPDAYLKEATYADE